jgi:hypothetical protein
LKPSISNDFRYTGYLQSKKVGSDGFSGIKRRSSITGIKAKQRKTPDMGEGGSASYNILTEIGNDSPGEEGRSAN